MKKAARDYLIFPLDVPTADEAQSLVQRLSPHVGLFKVGLELFVRCGPDIVHTIKSQGAAGVFLDLKLHDIPATVERAMQRIAALEVELTTVHCGESRSMLEAAVRGGQGRVKVLGVTVLTSVAAQDIEHAGFKPSYVEDMGSLVEQRAAIAKAAGCDGIVCSGLEVGGLKAALGRDLLAVTPGIRPDWEASRGDDQRRIVTPAQAVRAGSDYIVIGRPIRDAKDPVAAAQRITAEIASVL